MFAKSMAAPMFHVSIVICEKTFGLARNVFLGFYCKDVHIFVMENWKHVKYGKSFFFVNLPSLSQH